jgi:hypothetical protein
MSLCGRAVQIQGGGNGGDDKCWIGVKDGGGHRMEGGSGPEGEIEGGGDSGPLGGVTAGVGQGLRMAMARGGWQQWAWL